DHPASSGATGAGPTTDWTAIPTRPRPAPTGRAVSNEPARWAPRRLRAEPSPGRSACLGAATTPATDMPQVDQFAATAVRAAAPTTPTVSATGAERPPTAPTATAAPTPAAREAAATPTRLPRLI